MHTRARAAMLAGLTGLLVLAPVASARAHPLGNFSVNHYNGLVLHTDGVDLLAVVDSAEIPTQQELPSIDTDGDGDPSATELAAHAEGQCADLSVAVRLGVDGTAVPWSVQESTLETRPGAAGLPTLRLTCVLVATVDLSSADSVSLVDEYRGDRVGWHEITAQGDGVRLVDPPVPAASISDELRTYPDDLLSSPLADRSVMLEIEPGDGESGEGSGRTGGSQDPFTRLVSAGDRQLQAIIDGDELTPTLGVLSVLLAILLGAGHAFLPGHGKTVMAAYLAGRRGSRRDAFTVGAMVTVTHTASVLVLGLLISVSAAIVGEQALRYLGVASGLLIALVGGLLLRESLRSRRRRAALPTPTAALAVAGAQLHSADLQPGRSPADGERDTHVHPHGDGPGHEHSGGHEHPHSGGHEHPHSGGHEHPHSGGHEHPHSGGHEHERTGGHAHDHLHAHEHEHERDQEREHEHADAHGAEGAHGHSHGGGISGWLSHSHSHVEGAEHGHTHGPYPTDERGVEPRAGRAGLVGMGIAGGLVPSPSALVVLLGSAALGRTVFGVLLVLCYGLGMAATLTAVGLLLVRVRGRLDRFDTGGRLGVGASRVIAALPVITATLVLVVGLGLAVRGLTSPV